MFTFVTEHVFDFTSLTQKTMGAILWEIRMIAVKHLPSLTRIGSESLLCLDIRQTIEHFGVGRHVFSATIFPKL